ncbi:MAG: phage tail protein [Comamonas sp.]
MASWSALNTALPVLVRYGYTVTYNTERLTQQFNFGFGDLTISEPRIGANDLAQYNAAELIDSHVPAGQADRTALAGYTSVNWPGDDFPGNVQTVDGGALEQNDSVTNSGWVERQGSQGGRYIQLDITGRLFRQGSGGIENLSCVFEAQYQVPGSSTWVDFPFSPMTMTNGSSRVARETYSAYLDQPAIKFQVRRVTPDPTDANDVSELEWTRVKVFREGDALYPAQRRQGLLIKATGQLSGTVDRYSALVRSKCWVWDSSDPWDGSLPGSGNGAWTWTYTVNPAWLFLYFARGGFLNATAAPDHLGQAGWLDEPAASNGARLFGAGLTNNRIDYGTLIAWGQFCDSAGLTCRMALSSQRSAGAVLDDIAAAGRARKTWAPGKLSVWWEAAGQPWLTAFGASNIVAGTFRIAYITDDTVDEFGLSYPRSDNDYEADTVYATVPGVTLPVNQTVEEAVYSMPQAQAQRLVNLLAASAYYHRRTMTWESTLMGLTVATGDIIQLAHDLTRWAYSGRLRGLAVADGQVTAVDLSAEVELPEGGTEFWLMVTPPGGDPFTVLCAPPDGRTRRLVVQGTWSAEDAPGWLGAATLNDEAVEDWEDTLPEDWTFLAGPLATPGKRVRIIGMEPSSARRVKITARDEYEAYYPLEYGLGTVPEVTSGERLVARAFNLAALPADGGALRLVWELEAAHGADVRVSVDGGAAEQVPVAGHVTVLGRELLLPVYPAGTKLTISLLPVAAGTPVGVEGDVLELTIL